MPIAPHESVPDRRHRELETARRWQSRRDRFGVHSLINNVEAGVCDVVELTPALDEGRTTEVVSTRARLGRRAGVDATRRWRADRVLSASRLRFGLRDDL